MTTTYQLATLTCPSCVVKIETAVSGLKDVKSAKVLFNASKVKVESEADIETEVSKTITDLGFEVLSVEK